MVGNKNIEIEARMNNLRFKIKNFCSIIIKTRQTFDSKRAISDVSSLEDWSVETFDCWGVWFSVGGVLFLVW